MSKITDARRWELDEIKAIKKMNELDGFEWEAHGHGGGNRNVPRVTPIAQCKCLAVYPSDEVLAAMDEEGWAKVAVAFRRNGEGELAEMALRKSTNGAGVGIRHYDQQRTNIHVSVARHGQGCGQARRRDLRCAKDRGCVRVRPSESDQHRNGLRYR